MIESEDSKCVDLDKPGEEPKIVHIAINLTKKEEGLLISKLK